MPTRPILAKKKGQRKDVGTTSTGVHYDLRTDATQWNAEAIRRQAVDNAQKRLRQRRRKPAKKQSKRTVSALMTTGIVLVFAAAAVFFGDAMWDAVRMPAPTVAAVSTRRTQTATPRPSATVQPRQTGHVAVLPEAGQAAFVYLPKSGTRYHQTATCSGMKDAAEATLAEAIAQGYLPCKRCKPPEG